MHDLSRWKVLIVDDEPDNVGVLELVMKFNKANIRTAESAERCLEIMPEFLPTLILMDIQMPDMSGYDLLKRIRENPAWKGIPAVAVTAHAMIGDAEKVMAGGFDGYIPKPITPTELVGELVSILEAKGRL